jgi:hypothetical protein
MPQRKEVIDLMNAVRKGLGAADKALTSGGPGGEDDDHLRHGEADILATRLEIAALFQAAAGIENAIDHSAGLFGAYAHGHPQPTKGWCPAEQALRWADDLLVEHAKTSTAFLARLRKETQDA